MAYAVRGYLDLANWAPAFAGVVGGVCDLASHHRPLPPICLAKTSPSANPISPRNPFPAEQDIPRRTSHSPQNKIVTQQTRHPEEPVAPAKAGVFRLSRVSLPHETPAFAGVTGEALT